MIVTRNWLQEFINISHLSTQTICEALNSIGLEVESVNNIAIPKNVVVGHVIECKKHPDANKLNICQVDIGSKIIQIVCGASNVEKNQFVAVATIGTILRKNFIIKETTLRGVESFGMICSSSEIGLPKLNDGILVLDDSIGEIVIGKELSKYTTLMFEIIELELTANRGDCLSIHGVAREISTYFNLPFYKQEIKPEISDLAIGQVLDIKCENNINSNLIYKATDITNFKLSLLYKLRVAIVSVLKNTDIEIAVTYATHATGVLLNVYTKSIAYKNKDSNRVTLNIKKNTDNFNTVYGKTELSIIGVENGKISIQDNHVILEASYTAPDILSQQVFDTKVEIGDIYYRSSRGSEPDLISGIDYLAHLLSKNGATIYSGSEQYVDDIEEKNIVVNLSQINSIIGQDIEKDEIISILINLKFVVKNTHRDVLNITIPPFRHDIHNVADIAEEIVRMIGINNIKAKPFMFHEINRANKTSNCLTNKNILRSLAIANGFYETTTYIFNSKELLQKYKFPIVSSSKDIINPITTDLNTFRTTLLLNLVLAVSSNTKQGFKSIGLFEIGTVFDINRRESIGLGFIFSGDIEELSLHNQGKPLSVDLFGFGQKLTNCIGDFELEAKQDITNSFLHPYQCANIVKNNKIIGFISKLHPLVAKDFDISDDTFVAQIDFDILNSEPIQAIDISKYQASTRDLSLVVPKDTKYKEIKTIINNLKIKELKQYNLIDIYTDDELGDNSSFTIRFILQSECKTLEEEDIVSIMDAVQNILQDRLQLILR
ncbi:Phenylalanyl-tRNA synthetase beta chain [hydrothermal vent metagenome]|uniref:Phenylalanine--tRNA ligase beta subunit n=1 Tax=hydrothermal vent metagenome TaxID=652676 RepID=A0A3B1E0C7_9ZZZZ